MVSIHPFHGWSRGSNPRSDANWGYDVTVACDSSKVDERVRFPLPPPIKIFFFFTN